MNFADQRPNVHAIELLLFDRAGRFVRQYRDVMWDEETVIADLRRLAAE